MPVHRSFPPSVPAVGRECGIPAHPRPAGAVPPVGEDDLPLPRAAALSLPGQAPPLQGRRRFSAAPPAARYAHSARTHRRTDFHRTAAAGKARRPCGGGSCRPMRRGSSAAYLSDTGNAPWAGLCPALPAFCAHTVRSKGRRRRRARPS